MFDAANRLSRDAIRAIVREHLPKADQAKAIENLQFLVDLVSECKTKEDMVFSVRDGKLVDNEKVGGRWEDQQRQMRWVPKIIPTKPRGRRFIHWQRILISLLGAQYYAGTGKIPTRGGTEGPDSAFERFAAPFVQFFEIKNPKNLVKEYIAERRQNGPYAWCIRHGSRKQREKTLRKGQV
jgi:hypothetical protein